MGYQNEVCCEDCQNSFFVLIGGGVSFERLRCDRCGADTTIKKSNINLPVDAPFKQMAAAYSEAAGHCSCGGDFSFSGKPRCPRCNSTSLRVTRAGTLHFC